MNRMDELLMKSIQRLKNFEPEEGYFVAFSGGKDSQVIYHLCQMAGVKFDAHYSVSSVDPPELVRFIREKYPDVAMEIPHDKDGKPVTMWNLIPQKRMPPTRISRYCCEKLKEKSGKGRATVTGVRWAGSANRAANQGQITVVTKSKKLQKELEHQEIEHGVNRIGGIIMNQDDGPTRRFVENCYRTHKTLVNPIVDWEAGDVWFFLKSIIGVDSCCLYDEGFTRIGCIGCPMAGVHRWAEFERWPKYKELYLHAFDRMLVQRAQRALPTDWRSAEEVFDWWMENGVLPGQIRMDELMEAEKDED